MKKSTRRRRSKMDPIQAGEMVETTINKMTDAVEADLAANKQGAPAVAKIRILQEVMDLLRKYVGQLPSCQQVAAI